jgi:hypothetical protein
MLSEISLKKMFSNFKIEYFLSSPLSKSKLASILGDLKQKEQIPNKNCLSFSIFLIFLNTNKVKIQKKQNHFWKNNDHLRKNETL